ncbi:MAG: DUF2914 domain-containing protein [Desulfobacteraceae bacterium]|nr:MAG: DUF2914 domain-containing protein [Desulfobacteraceae bacterium]
MGRMEKELVDSSGGNLSLLLRMFFAALVMGALCLSPVRSFSQQNDQPSPSDPGETPVLKAAVICESLQDGSPVNAGAVFSIRTGRIFCLTSFDPMLQRRSVHHRWFHRGQLTNSQRLWIHSPPWSAASSIQLREADKGPWQVEVSDSSGRIIKVLRFSIVD